MKKILLSCALLFSSSIVASEKQPYHVNLYTGLNIFDKSQKLDNKALVGASVTMYEKSLGVYALQLGYEHINQVAYKDIDLNTNINRYYVNMLVDGEEELDITPYLSIGGGYEQLSHLYTEYPEVNNQAFASVGIGFRYRLGDYVNIVLEGDALGKLDSEKIDYVAKLGIDVMFGGLWKRKPNVIDALDKEETTAPRREPEVALEPKRSSVSKKPHKKKWITPEVVEEIFAEEEQEERYKKAHAKTRTVDTNLESVHTQMLALKKEMAVKEALLAEKLALLEQTLLASKEKQNIKNRIALTQKQTKNVTLKIEAEKKKVRLALEAQREAAQIEATKKAKREAQRVAKAKRAVQKAKLAKKAFNKAKAVREAKRLAKLEAKRIAEELVAYKRLQDKQIAEEKRMAEEVVLKTEEERTDTLHIANGMAVFSD